ncbi:unnamed protein product [Candidula unifasciata]|uniref:Copper transport protein n=1 Tax=Candidula unifasciata TaxID=100452 RepID=A0A8S3YGE9_9EUPU|nr:unnamed protein product [Candidula unifasciata]
MHKKMFHTNLGDVLLFPQWVLNGKKETYLTCLLLVVLGIAYQGIKFARQQYGRRCRNLHCKRYILNKGHLLQTLMYLLQFIGGYALMLAVMTYNIWILISVLAGFGLGYLFFGWGEYEEPSAVLHLPPARSTSRSYLQTCGGVTPSSSATQELLSYSKSDQDLNLKDSNTNSLHCSCSTKV